MTSFDPEIASFVDRVLSAVQPHAVSQKLHSLTFRETQFPVIRHRLRDVIAALKELQIGYEPGEYSGRRYITITADRRIGAAIKSRELQAVSHEPELAGEARTGLAQSSRPMTRGFVTNRRDAKKATAENAEDAEKKP